MQVKQDSIRVCDVARSAGISMVSVTNWICRGFIPFDVNDRRPGRSGEVEAEQALKIARFFIVADAFGPAKACELWHGSQLDHPHYTRSRISIDLSVPDLEPGIFSREV